VAGGEEKKKIGIIPYTHLLTYIQDISFENKNKEQNKTKLNYIIQGKFLANPESLNNLVRNNL